MDQIDADTLFLGNFDPDGTPVRAPVTGIVSQIDVLFSGDYLIFLQQPPSRRFGRFTNRGMIHT